MHASETKEPRRGEPKWTTGRWKEGGTGLSNRRTGPALLLSCASGRHGISLLYTIRKTHDWSGRSPIPHVSYGKLVERRAGFFCPLRVMRARLLSLGRWLVADCCRGAERGWLNTHPTSRTVRQTPSQMDRLTGRADCGVTSGRAGAAEANSLMHRCLHSGAATEHMAMRSPSRAVGSARFNAGPLDHVR